MAAAAIGPVLRAFSVSAPQPPGPHADDLLGPGPAAEAIRDAIRRAALAPYSVLVEGESGSVAGRCPPPADPVRCEFAVPAPPEGPPWPPARRARRAPPPPPPTTGRSGAAPRTTATPPRRACPPSGGRTRTSSGSSSCPARGASTPVVWGDKHLPHVADGRRRRRAAVRRHRRQGEVDGEACRAPAQGTATAATRANDASASCSTDGKHVWAFVAATASSPASTSTASRSGTSTSRSTASSTSSSACHWTPVLYKGKLYLQVMHRNAQMRASPSTRPPARKMWKVDRPGLQQGREPGRVRLGVHLGGRGRAAAGRPRQRLLHRPQARRRRARSGGCRAEPEASTTGRGGSCRARW